jgi:hypothetical protein
MHSDEQFSPARVQTDKHAQHGSVLYDVLELSDREEGGCCQEGSVGWMHADEQFSLARVPDDGATDNHNRAAL